ncbi:putative dehydrogenase [Amycolatopsis bartoniae]|uniref:Oxidoreductase n=1 Tax=Amycolatopsis bartoniae TaxID=941986 RepID=A0A8H9J3X9_9PSEU|nr:Gfo/Idh/MocA family oxidoreductase [Amycolatopsis bartoniae]MBB2938419.1 putative dehydrogenase [Amycolatopsis bartoniae]TVT06089.1 Gfo/Idh/MocA family oxidoreductase [Amycolatopsis bartoniae]GHF71152.1 oxidoreductase [Amycolatopsis bartoniae]
MKSLRAGVIGCGNVAGNHASAYRDLPDTELVACADVDSGRAARFAAEYGAAGVSPGEIFGLGLDVVSVCTPHPTHEAVVIEAAAHGVHVLCEKPIAIGLGSAARMVAACERAGVRLGVLFQRRFWPAARRIRAAIDDGTLGTPVLGQTSVLLHRDTSYYTADAWRGTWATDGGGVLMTQAVHNIDLLQWFMGDAVEVACSYATVKHGAAIEVEDTAVATVRFASGGLATISASTALTPGLGTRVQVTGRTGATAGLAEYPEGSEARLDVWAVAGQEAATAPFGAGLTGDLTLAQINGSLAPFHALQIADFTAAVREGREPAVTGREAVKSLAILTALYASAASGSPEPVPALGKEITV